jgi:alpha-L-glutamate ligase-like protein
MFQKITQIRKNRRKVLGRNERYLEYIRPHNLREAFQIADDKILTKKVLKEYNIPVPTQITSISNRSELERTDFESFPNSFVIKPVHGVRGGGVEIFYNRDKNGNWIKGNGARLSIEEIKTLCRDILDGKYSLHNEPDTVLVEERVRAHKAFRYHTYKGTPDIRVIVFNNIPIMSYLRLPTEKSEGKANLDQGAIGAGIDMAEGKTTFAISGKSGFIERIPGNNLPISGFKIPYWNKILEYAILASQATKLGFGGFDFLIDKELGPLLVEMNARPGLSIQLSNRAGLRARLKKASGIKVTTVEKGIRLAKDLFGGEIEESIETITGKKVIGIYENVEIFGLNEKSISAKAKIDTGADSTSIDRDIAYKLGYGDIIDEFEKINIPENFTRAEGKELMDKLTEELVPKYEKLIDINLIHSSHGMSLRPYIEIELELGDYKFETKASIYDRSKLNYPIIVGRKSLSGFLIDPRKT